MRRPRSLVWCSCVSFALGAGLVAISGWARGAEREFVGVLALAVEDQVAEQLGLTKGQRENLEALIDAREQAAIELVAQVRNLPVAERNARLAEFRRESEAKGLAFLSRQQLARLERIRLQREGLSTLADPAVADRLQLKPEQRARVEEIVKQRAEKLARAAPPTAHVIRAEMERELASVLDESQRSAWEAMARPGAADAEPAAAGPEAAPAPGAGGGGWRAGTLASAPGPAVVPKPAGVVGASEESGAAGKDKGPPAKETEAPAAGPAGDKTEAALGMKFPFPPPPGVGPASPAGPPTPSGSQAPPGLPSPAGPQAAAGSPAPAGPPAPLNASEKAAPPVAESISAPGDSKAWPAQPLGDEAGEGKADPAAGVGAPSPGPGKPGVPGPGFPFAPFGQGPGMAAGSGAPALPPARPEQATGSASPQAAGAKTEGATASSRSSEPASKLGEPMRGGKLRFNFRYAPWKDVLEWFADLNQLSLVMEAPPKGTFNYIDPEEYTPAQALDLLNRVLQAKGYRLLRRDRMLWVINLEDKIPDNLIETIAPEELDQRGEFEIVRVLFQLNRVSPEEVQQELEKVKGPQGVVVVFPKAGQVLVTEGVGKLRIMRRMIEAMENPGGAGGGPVATVELRRITAQEASALLRQLMDIPADRNATTDGSLRFATDPEGKKVLLTGKPEVVARAKEIVEALDAGKGADRLESTPQLEVYTINSADPNAVLQVLQTLLAGEPDVRLAIDPKTGNLVAYARLAQHKTIRETLEQLQRDSRRVEVFQLRTLDPQVALAAVQKIFVGESSATAPKVEADGNTRQLIVRGSEPQILEIREMLRKLGEDVDGATQVAGGKVRVLPFSGRAARTALEQIQQIWPTMRANPIRQVMPSSTIPSVRPSSEGELERERGAGSAVPDHLGTGQWGPSRPAAPAPGGPAGAPGGVAPVKEPEFVPMQRARPASPGLGRTAGAVRGAAVYWVSDAGQPAGAGGAADDGWRASGLKPAATSGAAQATPPSGLGATGGTPGGQSPGPPGGTAPAAIPQHGAPAIAQRSPSDKAAPIIVAPGPGGIMITSEDPEALAEFEQLLQSLAASASSNQPEITIFYLKHAKAAVVADTLDAIFGGGTGGGGGGGSLLGDLAGAAIGGPGGNLVGALLGGGDSGTLRPTGDIQITPDSRLNALIVQANPADLDMIEELLKILDQRDSPEDVLAAAKPRLIPVKNTQAQEVAEIVRQVYQDRMVAGPNAPQRPPSPQEFFQMIRGMAGRRGGLGGRRGTTEDTPKMSIGVDARTNSLVVVAPDNLFQEVKALVEELDQAAAGESNEALEVVTLQRTNSEAVRRALVAMMGDSVRIGQGTTPSASGSRPSQPPSPADSFRGFGGFRRRTDGSSGSFQPGFPGGFPGVFPGGFPGGGSPGSGFRGGGFPGGGFPGGFRGSMFAPQGGPSFQPPGASGVGGSGRTGFGRSGTSSRSSRPSGSSSGRSGR